MNSSTVTCGHIKEGQNCVRLHWIDDISHEFILELCKKCSIVIYHELEQQIDKVYGPFLRFLEIAGPDR
jgi:hypothetical protein